MRLGSARTKEHDALHGKDALLRVHLDGCVGRVKDQVSVAALGSSPPQPHALKCHLIKLASMMWDQKFKRRNGPLLGLNSLKVVGQTGAD